MRALPASRLRTIRAWWCRSLCCVAAVHWLLRVRCAPRSSACPSPRRSRAARTTQPSRVRQVQAPSRSAASAGAGRRRPPRPPLAAT
ncbi:hypothetical protein PF003_g25533 [Phytophthora fragariae]|nr:hypothetical protein PF003_g25533 [Phytophthora fragariae]